MTWLTQQTFDRLHAELEERRGPIRAEIVERISSARDEGDLKENGGYHAAKDEQGTNEGRIRQLEELLSTATTAPATQTATTYTRAATGRSFMSYEGGELRERPELYDSSPFIAQPSAALFRRLGLPSGSRS